MRILLLAVFLLKGVCLFSQATYGMSGLIHIPSARMFEDGQLTIGAAYIPKPYFTYPIRGGYRDGSRRINPGLNTYITYGILPYIEIMFRYTHELNMAVNTNTQYFPDRQLSIRARIIKEKNLIPSIVIGMHDASSIFANTIGGSNFSATYFVINKQIYFNSGEIDLTLGSTIDFSKFTSNDYKGIFSGITFTPKIFNQLKFMIEHNTKVINAGILYSPFEKINMMIGLWEVKKPTFSLNFNL